MFAQLAEAGQSRSQLIEIILTASESLLPGETPNPEVRFDALVCHNKAKQRLFFQGRKPETGSSSAVSKHATPSPSSKRAEKPLRFQRFQASEPAAPIATGVQSNGRQ